MPLTDAQIYEAHPDIAALNEEYVAIGKQLPELANHVAATGEALANATDAQRAAVNEATLAVQAAEKRLKAVRAEQAVAVNKAQASHDEAQSQQRRATERRRELQQRHNAAIEAVQQAAAAQTEDDTPTE